jgi:hypothetical protein
MAKRGIQEINAGSMADIAFLLLIFFLVTTTMDVDSGISRKLPEKPDPNIKPPIKKEKNVFVVNINRNGDILVENETFMKVDQIKEAAIEFLDNGGGFDNAKDKNPCDYCKGKKLPTSSDHPKAAVISLESARGTEYGTYIAVQNELVAAYNFLRDREAKAIYGVSYKDLDDDYKDNLNDDDIKAKRDKIKDMYPMILSEAEPVKYN